jgi:hypothetical protein
MNEVAVEMLEEVGRWRSRDVSYIRGSWDLLRDRIPKFELRPFEVGDSMHATASPEWFGHLERLPALLCVFFRVLFCNDVTDVPTTKQAQPSHVSLDWR